MNSASPATLRVCEGWGSYSEGYGVTVKVAALDALPPGVVTAIFPVVAVEGTEIVTCVSELTTNEVTFPLPTESRSSESYRSR